MTGYLELFIGPMWSGKTSELIRLHKQFNYCEVPILAINYINDTRYSETTISTHDKREIPCIRAVQSITEVSDIINDQFDSLNLQIREIILINEGQFFKDIVPWVKLAVDKYQ